METLQNVCAVEKVETKKLRKNKINTPALKKEGQYCCACEDGGDIILCTLCQAPYCYDIREDLTEAVEMDCDDTQADGEDKNEYASLGGCVTIPRAMEDNMNSVFRCPVCLEKNPEFPIDYTINLGCGSSQRLTVNADLVIVMVTLPSLTQRGRTIFETIRSQLGAFEMEVTCYPIELPWVLPKVDLKAIASAKYEYHLAFIFLTESDQAGGWWFNTVGSHDAHPSTKTSSKTGRSSRATANTSEEEPTDAQTSEGYFLQTMLGGYGDVLERAISSRIFGLCCGLNLTVPKVVDQIATCLEGSKWDSILLPTVSSLMPEEYSCMFPELFTQLYYKSAQFKTAVLKTWTRSYRAREHTDLLLIENPGDSVQRTVRKYSYAPVSTRPWGVDTPLAHSFCKCDENANVNWTRPPRRGKPKFGEYFATLISSCKHSVLYLAVFNKDFKLVKISGTTVVVQSYCKQLGGFPLDMHERFQFRVARVRIVPLCSQLDIDTEGLLAGFFGGGRKGKQAGNSRETQRRLSTTESPPFKHDSPWTLAGCRLLEQGSWDAIGKS